MTEVINLRTLRKQKAREDKAQMAEANRQKFGRSKAEKQQLQLEAKRAEKALDGHARDE